MIKASMRMTGCSVFMQDGALCHTAGSIKEWFAAHNVDVLDWISQSCDLNPIENLWRGLNRIIRNMPTCSNLTELAKTITKAWKQLTKDTALLNSLTDSMPRRVEAVIQAKY